MATTAITNLQQLPPPQSPFVDPKTGVLSNDGYWWLIDLLTQLANAIPTVSVSDNVGAAGATQATATPLTSQWNNVTSVTKGRGVLLESLDPGQSQEVLNSAGSPIDVYPPAGVQIVGQSVNAPYPLVVGDLATFRFFSSTLIIAP